MAAVKKIVGGVALVAIATVLSGCYTYEVKMSYKCVTPPTTAGAMCMEWEQIGGVKTPTTCFPGQATVTTRTGPKAMSDLQIGDEILGVDHASGKNTFSPVRAWIHRDANADVVMSAVTGVDGTLVASPRHLLATGSASTLAYEFASELKGGSLLLRADGGNMAVSSVSETTGHGLYAPLTGTSNFFVGGPQLKTSVLAHNFAEVRNPRRYDSIVQGLISTAKFFVPSINDVDKNAAYIHPIFRMLMKAFPMVMESHGPSERVTV